MRTWALLRGSADYDDRVLVLVVAEHPLVSELAHGVDDRQEPAALVGQRVLDAGRRLRIAVPVDELLRLEDAQPLREGARADAGTGVLELGEAPGAFREVVDEERRPLRADDLR